MAIEEIFVGNETEWLDALPIYQRNTIEALLVQGKSHSEVAIAWLSASGPDNTFPFGTERNNTIFFEKLVEEIEKFICGADDYYTEDRKKLLTVGDTAKALIISNISVAIAPILHSSAAYIGPAIALILITIAQIGRNAWCSMQRELKVRTDDKEDSLDEKTIP